MGRKNRLFIDTPACAEASAIAYRIMATARKNNLNICPYLKHVPEVFSSTPDSKLNDVIPTLFQWLIGVVPLHSADKAEIRHHRAREL